MRSVILASAMFVVMAWGSVALAQGTARSLDIQPGARQNSMGAAGVALESDPADAMWWNPAALGFAEWHGVGYSYAQLVPGLADDVIHQHIAAAGRVGSRAGIGASATFLDYDASESESWFAGDENSERSAAFALGFRVTPELAFGVTGKHVIVDYGVLFPRGDTFGFDIGGLYRHTFDGARVGVGLNVQNLGPELKYGSASNSWPLSRNTKLGGALTLPIATGSAEYDLEATAVADWDHSLVTDDFDVLHVGAELSGGFGRRVRLAVRGGYYDDQMGDITDWTYGVGGRVWGFSVDYAQIPQARDSGLPNVEKWTVGLHTDALMEKLAAR